MANILSVLRATAYWRDRGGLSVSRQLLEMIALRAWRGLGPNYYLLGRFWRREMPWRDKLDHLNAREFHRIVDVLNPRVYRKISQHKVVEKAVLSLHGFPTPRYLGYLHADRGMTSSGRPLRTAADLERFLDDCAASRLVFKPVEGSGGAGFHAMDIVRGAGGTTLRDLKSGDALAPERLLARLTSTHGYIVECFLDQHPLLASMNASSVNTVRLWVLKERRGCRFAGAILRIGRRGSLVDNISAGGLFCPIDVASGALLHVRESDICAEPMTRHPDGGAQIAGVQLPHWKAVLDLAARAVDAFPNIRFAGLDIAIASEGPQLIEVNVLPDWTNAVDFDVPMRRFFRP